ALAPRSCCSAGSWLERAARAAADQIALARVAAVAIARHWRAVGDGDGLLIEQGSATHAGRVYRGDEIVVDAIGRQLGGRPCLEAENLVAAGGQQRGRDEGEDRQGS